MYIASTTAAVAELADAQDLGAKTRNSASLLPSIHRLKNQQFNLGVRLRSLAQNERNWSQDFSNLWRVQEGLTVSNLPFAALRALIALVKHRQI